MPQKRLLHLQKSSKKTTLAKAGFQKELQSQNKNKKYIYTYIHPPNPKRAPQPAPVRPPGPASLGCRQRQPPHPQAATRAGGESDRDRTPTACVGRGRERCVATSQFTVGNGFCVRAPRRNSQVALVLVARARHFGRCAHKHQASSYPAALVSLWFYVAA